MVWHHQEFEHDAFMTRCQAANPAGSNCAETLGPDYDFGGSSAILRTIDGKDILLAAGKGGVALALDPATRRSPMADPIVGKHCPARLGLVVWGSSRRRPRVLPAAASRGRPEGARP